VFCALALAAAAWIGTASLASGSLAAEQTLRVPARYQLEPDGSSVAFAVSTIAHSHLTMRFHRLQAQLDAPRGGLDTLSVVVTIDATSVEANLPFVTRLVKGDTMLDVEHYPVIRFVSTGFIATGVAKGLLTGNLTIRDATHPIALRVTFDSVGDDPAGANSIAFSADGSFSRSMFGLSNWSYAIGDNIEMTIHVQFISQRADR
jgi:polyisoprenoid-binding protein YceI